MTRLACAAVCAVSVAAVGGPNAGNRAEAAAALEQLYDGRLTSNQAINRLSFTGQERYATVQLTEWLRRAPDARSYAAALEVLSAIAVNDDLAAQAFTRALDDEDLSNRLAGLRGLGRLKRIDAVRKLEPLLQDKVLGVRREAARALGAIGEVRSAAPLLNAARAEDDPEVRASMLVAVGRTGNQRQTAGLATFLQSSSETTRFAAAQALCQLGAPRGQAFAKKLLASTDKFERAQGVALFEGASARVAAPLLTPMLKDAYLPIRAAAARVLYLGGDQSRLDWLVMESFKAAGDDKLAYENELEKLRLSDEERRAILEKAGLR